MNNDNEERILYDKPLYLEKDPIFRRTVDMDYIIQPKGMLKRGSMCSTELLSKTK